MAMPLAETVGMLAELLLDQHAQGRAVPIVGDEQVVGGAHGDEPRAEAVEEIVDRARARGGLPRDGVDHREQVLAAMGQLAQQEAELVLVGLALADVDGDRRGADNGVLLVAQRLDHEIEGALAPEQLEIGLELLRGPGLHRLALRRHDGLCRPRREDLGVGLADQLFGREARGRVVHPGKAHLLVLAEHGDGRAAERDLDALLRLGQLLGARLDAFLELMPRFLQLVGRVQMRGDLRLQAVARGKPHQARRDPPEKKCNGAGERGARNLQDCGAAPTSPGSQNATSGTRCARPIATMKSAQNAITGIMSGLYPPRLRPM